MKLALHLRRILHAFTFLVLLASLTPLAPAQPGIGAAAASASLPAKLLKDIYTANASSNPDGIYDFGNQFFFRASDPAHGTELWVSNGTLAGTKMVTDLTPGPGSSYPDNFTTFQGKLFFSLPRSLYSSDGSAEQTSKLFTLDYDNGYPNINDMLPVGDWLYMALSNQKLKRYNGLTQELETVSPLNVRVNGGLVLMDGGLYLKASDATSGFELWRYDTVTGQTTLVKDMCSSTCITKYYSEPGSHPQSMTVVGDTLYFIATDDTHGAELWASDGSEGGTHLVKDIYTGQESADPQSLTAAAGWLYFSADDGSAYGRELWRSDGTPANTALVADVASGPVSSTPAELTALADGSQLFFTARDAVVDQGHGLELWYVPVSVAGAQATPQLIDIFDGASSSFPTSLKALGNSVYYAAQSTPGNVELWKSDTTNTLQVADLVPGSDGSNPRTLTPWNGKLVFSAVDAVHGRELWTSNGTAPGTVLVGDLTDAVDVKGSLVAFLSSDIMTNVGGDRIRYFSARDALHGEELWRTDGTTDGTWMVKDVYPGPTGSLIFCNKMAEMNGILYFCGEDPEHGIELWRTDGTSDGTWLVKDIDPTSDGHIYNSPTQLTPAGNNLFFMLQRSDGIPQLWATDGTAGGTRAIKDFPKVNWLNDAAQLAAIGSTLVFNVNNHETKTTQLWRSDGTPAGTQSFFGPFHYADYLTLGPVKWMTTLSEKVYISMNNMDIPGGMAAESNDRLWVTDGTTSGTMVIGAASEPFPYTPENLIQVGDNLIFSARVTSEEIYDAQSLWKLPIPSTTPSLVKVTYGQNHSYLTSLNGSNLLLLTRDKYTSETIWWTIDGQTSETKRMCYDCYPNDISNKANGVSKVYFSARETSQSPYALWVTNGTQSGTAEVTVPGTGQHFQAPGSFLGTPNAFYFTANDSIHGSEPWVIVGNFDYAVYLPAVRR